MTPLSAQPVPAGLSDLKLRAVRVAPSFVTRVTPVDLNIVHQQMSAPQNFDLIIATNILVSRRLRVVNKRELCSAEHNSRLLTQDRGLLACLLSFTKFKLDTILDNVS